jgi:hypothetical protein
MQEGTETNHEKLRIVVKIRSQYISNTKKDTTRYTAHGHIHGWIAIFHVTP